MDPVKTYAILKKLPTIWDKIKKTKQVWFPSDKNLQEELKDPNVRDTIQNQFNDCIFVQGEMTGIAYNSKELKKKINDSFESSDGKFRLINGDFSDETKDYDSFLDKSKKGFLDKIKPYLSKEHFSILSLAEYAESKYQKKKNVDADRIKSDIGKYYGSYGRKLANLYCRGYVDDATESFILPALEKVESEDDKKSIVKNFIDRIVDSSESIFFIGKYTPDSTADTILALVSKGYPYIALHAVGKENIKKLKKILDKILESDINLKEYEISTQNPTMPHPRYKAFEVFIIKN